MPKWNSEILKHKGGYTDYWGVVSSSINCVSFENRSHSPVVPIKLSGTEELSLWSDLSYMKSKVLLVAKLGIAITDCTSKHNC